MTNPTNPPLKEPKQETKEREPTPKQETLTPATLKPIMPTPAPNTENHDKTENQKPPTTLKKKKAHKKTRKKKW